MFQRQRDHLREALMKKLKVETKKEFSVDRFKHKNENIAFYTGFPTYDVMMQCYKLLNVGPNGEGFRYITSMSETKRPSRRKLSLVDEIFMTLVSIRLGLFGLNIFIGSNNKHKALQCLSHSYTHSYTLKQVCARGFSIVIFGR